MAEQENRSSEAKTSLGLVLGRPVSAKKSKPGPPLILAAIYALAIIVGSLCLRTEWAAPGGMDWSAALFTATSAVTVTGLEVVPIHDTLSPAGLVVVAVLMQIGGLGLMTFAVFAFVILGFDLERPVLQAEFDTVAKRRLWPLAIRIIVTALIVQAIGITLMGFALRESVFGWGDAAFLGISAFNNAGFAPFEGSLKQFADKWLVLATVAALLVIGGLGFFVLGNLVNAVRTRSWSSITVHAKLTLAGVGTVSALGWVGLWLLTDMGPGLSLFQALTPRTAGFDAVGTDTYGTAASILTIVLMFIGAGATSTGGGIKIATVSILVLALIARVGGRDAVFVFGARVPFVSVNRVMILVLVAAAMTATGAAGLMWSEGAGPLDAAFEATSAFGTVGLSRGITADAGPVGQAILATMMFFGRVGPLALAYMLAARFIGPPEEAERQLPLG